MNIFRLTAIVAAIPLLFASSLEAQTQSFHVKFKDSQTRLAGNQQNPGPNTSSFGSVVLVIDMSTGIGSLGGVFSMLGNRTASHLHGPAAIGSNGPIIATIDGDTGTSGFIDVDFTLTPSQISALSSGLLYIDVHSSIFPLGDLRGQIVQQTNRVLPSGLGNTGPLLLDAGGNDTVGPIINDPEDPFNLAIQCKRANPGGLFVIKVFTAALGTPISTKFGLLYLAGQNLGSFVGVQQNQRVELFPTGLVLPNDLSLVGMEFFAQGFCSRNNGVGSLTNALQQVIGF